MPKTVDVETRIQAVEEYLTNQENTTFRKVAATYGVNEASLGRWIKNELRDNPFNPVNLKHNKKGLKLRAQQDLTWLATSVLPYKWNPHKKEGISIPPDPVHVAMVDLYNRPERFKLGLFPRGTCKTTLLTICGTIQLIIKNPNTTVLIVSEKWNLARKILMEIKAHLIFNKKLREMFGDFMPSTKDEKWKELKKLGGLWNRDWIYIQQRTTFAGMKQPSIGTAGLDCEVTGQHADFQWLDDLVGPKNITTWEQKQKVIDYIDQCIDLASTAGRMFMVGTPWAFDDAYTYAQENWLKQKDGKRKLFAFNCLPVRDENRVSIMPSKYTNDKIDTIYNTKPLFKFACQYMCDPRAEGNSLIKLTDIERREYGQFDYANANVTGDYDVYITVDPGLSENPKKCWTGITLGIPIYPYDLYIDYSIKMKVKPTPVIEKLLEIIQMPQYMGKVRSIGIEDVAFQEIYWKSLQEELRRLADKTSSEEEATAYRSIWVRGLPAIGSKDNRIYAMEPYFRAGQIHIQRDQRDLLYQIAHYPHISGNNRDLLDALAYIFDILPPLFRANPSAIIRLRDKPVKEEDVRPESEIAHSYTEEMAMAAQETETW